MEIDRKRRDRLYIISEILDIAKSGSLKTQIMYGANLSFAQLNEYLNFLIKVGFLEIQKENRKNNYITTDKGDRYLEKYKNLAVLLKENQENYQNKQTPLNNIVLMLKKNLALLFRDNLGADTIDFNYSLFASPNITKSDFIQGSINHGMLRNIKQFILNFCHV